MGTKKGQVRKTARRAYEPKTKWLPFEGFMPNRAKRENWVGLGLVKKINGKWYYKR